MSIRHTSSMLVASLVLYLIFGLSPSAVATQSTFFSIDYPGQPAGTDTIAHGINDSGQIVGFYITGGITPFHGFLLTGPLFAPTFTTIDVPGATDTSATGINNAGTIVGEYNDSSGDHGFVDTQGAFQTINVLGAVSTRVNGINLTGNEIVGEYSTSLGPCAGPFGGCGFVVGSDGTLTTIQVPGSFRTEANGINSKGEIVGSYMNAPPDPVHGFLMTKQGKFTTIDVPGASQTRVVGINKFDDIVGWFQDGTGVHGFLEDRHGNFTTINFPGTTNFTRVFGINNAGDFVGEFLTAANTHGFLDPPAADTVVNPEPSTWLLLGSGLVGLILYRRKWTA